MPKKIKVKPEEWAERRKQGIGGSDVAAILRLHPYKSIFQTWCEKTGTPFTHSTHEDLDPKSVPMRCGIIKEPLVRELYEEHTGRKGIHNPGFYISDSNGEDWCFANPDWLEIKTDQIARGAEFKCVSPFLSRDWEGGSIPIYYASQIAWYQRLLQVEEWDAAALIGDAEFIVMPIHRDIELERMIYEIVHEFWFKNVKEKIEPDIDSSEGCRTYLQNKYKARGKNVLELDENHPATGLMIRYRELSDQEKEIQSEKELVRSTLIESIGLASGIKSGPLKATHSAWATTKVNYKGVVEEIGAPSEVIQKHTTEGQSHRLTVTDARVKQKRLPVKTASQNENNKVE